MKEAVAVIILVALAALLALTNPSIEDYQNYIRQEILRESQKSNDSLGQVMGSLFSGLAGGLAASQTIRNDYLFFSTYELTFGKTRFKALGILKRFFVLESLK